MFSCGKIQRSAVISGNTKEGEQDLGDVEQKWYIYEYVLLENMIILQTKSCMSWSHLGK